MTFTVASNRFVSKRRRLGPRATRLSGISPLGDLARCREGASGSADDGAENGRDCVICMTEPRDTTVLPCRHMCMCSDCAKMLRMQSEKCPICRTPIEQLLQIKITKQGDAQNNASSSMPAAAGAALVS